MPVNTEHPDYRKFAPKWRKCSDVYDGEDAIHEGGEAYLAKLKDQSQPDYEAYKNRTPFYNATYRTIVGLVGMMFRRPPKIELPAAIEDMKNDITLSGVPLLVFSQEVATGALKVGRLGILVDCPTVEVPQGQFVTLADQIRQNIRPSLQMYCASSIINWKTQKIANQVVLTMVVLKEVDHTAKDEFEDEAKEVFRVLSLDEDGNYRVRRYTKKKVTTPQGQAEQKTPAGDDWELLSDVYPIMDGKPMDYIPFVFISAEDLEPDVSDPPLIDLVNLNLSHYRTSADYYHGAHFTGLPTPWITGYVQDKPGEKMYIGSSHAWVFASDKVRVGYLEYSGQGLTTLKQILDDNKTDMAVLGARLLEPQKQAVETAETKTIHRKGEESILAMMSQNISMGIERALEWFAEWAGADPTGVTFAIDKNFFPIPMDSAMLTAQVSSWQMGAISDKTLFENLQNGDVIPEDRTYEEEQSLIEAGAQRMSALNSLTQPLPPNDPNNPDTQQGGDPGAAQQ